MPLLEETADLSSLSTGGNNTSQNPAGSVTTNNSVPTSAQLPPGIPPEVVQRIQDAQNSGITSTPQRRGNPGESESGLFGNNLPPVPRTPEELAELANQRRAGRTPPARPIDVFGEIRRGTIEPQRSIGVNYFLDIDQFGFSLNKNRLTTDFKLNEKDNKEIY